MKITKKGEYALKALLCLVEVYPHKTRSLREIAQREKLPLKFLEQIMMILKRHGIVQSTKGKLGGYCLAEPPAEITLGKIIRAVEGPLAPIANAEEIQKSIHRDERHAGLYLALLEVRNAISEILDKTTLEDIYEKSLELMRSKPTYSMYYI